MCGSVVPTEAPCGFFGHGKMEDFMEEFMGFNVYHVCLSWNHMKSACWSRSLENHHSYHQTKWTTFHTAILNDQRYIYICKIYTSRWWLLNSETKKMIPKCLEWRASIYSAFRETFQVVGSQKMCEHSWLGKLVIYADISMDEWKLNQLLGASSSWRKWDAKTTGMGQQSHKKSLADIRGDMGNRPISVFINHG